MQESLYQTADARDSLSDSGCRSLYIRKRMQETISDSECKRLDPTVDAGESISDSGCRRLVPPEIVKIQIIYIPLQGMLLQVI